MEEDAEVFDGHRAALLAGVGQIAPAFHEGTGLPRPVFFAASFTRVCARKIVLGAQRAHTAPRLTAPWGQWEARMAAGRRPGNGDGNV